MSSQAVEQIKDKLLISDIISSYITLNQAGAHFKGKCPFHNEKTPSFMVSSERGSYYCFGCGAKGDMFTFIQEFEKVDFKQALKILADRAGVVLDVYQGPQEKTEEDEKERLQKIMETATLYFEEQLKLDEASLSYLHRRGLEDSTIKKWRVGTTKKGWNHLYDHLKMNGYKDEDIEKAGLIKKGNHGFYDRFRSRIIFPLFDPIGKVIAFSGRYKEWEKEEGREVEAKYLNSPDTLLFDKSRTLYGFHIAKSAITKWKCFLLVEGQMDLLMCQQLGYTNTIATSGTALTKQQLEMLMRFSKNLLIAYDGDKAGVQAARRAWSLGVSLGIDVKIAVMPQGQDPADIIKTNPSLFKQAIKKGVHIIEFYLQSLVSSFSGRALGKQIELELLPYVKAIQSPIDQAHFISLISARSDIKEEIILEAVKKSIAFTGSHFLPSEEKSDTMSSQYNNSKQRLIAGTYLLLNNEEKAKAYIHNADEIREELQFAVEEWLGKNTQNPESYLKDLLQSLKKEELQNELKNTMKAYFEAEQKGEYEKSANLLKQSDDIRKQISYF